jgi:DNA-binding NarL/FixJ family response regulator
VKKYKILLADDHLIFQKELEELIGKRGGCKVAGKVNDVIDLLNAVKKIDPDMLILETAMLGLRALDVIREIKSQSPLLSILVVTINAEKDFLYQAIFSGADGYLLKEDVARELFPAIGRIQRGGIYLPKRLKKELSPEFKGVFRGEGRTITQKLTRREKEVLTYIAKDHSNWEIGEILGISVRTVEKHRAVILKKLNTRKTTYLVKYAIRTGLVSLWD